MLVEIRRYTIVPGRREEFVTWFETEAARAMRAVGIRILGSFVSVDDPNVFVYLRGFADEEERDRLTRAFRDSDIWTGRLRKQAQELEMGYDVEVVRSTPASAVYTHSRSTSFTHSPSPRRAAMLHSIIVARRAARRSEDHAI
jgi:hypothetical protein